MNDESEKDKQRDDELFRQAMRGVTPLKPDNRVRHRPPPKKPPERRHPDDGPAHEDFSDGMFDETCPDRLHFERAGGARKSVIKKLRQGKLPVDGVLDLHGLSAREAARQLGEFLQECRRMDHHHVIIIHGKGFRSQNQPVIKPMVNRWLRQTNQVLAFCSAQPKDGGTGAVYVLLRKSWDE